MKKKVLFAVMALIALASCSSDEMVSVSSPPEPTTTDLESSQAIVFSSASKGITRADFKGAEAAAKLGNKFVVSAKKGSTTASTEGVVTFDNYLVEYEENTANVTESNSTNWEYVGKGRIQHAIDHGITSQTIKYWDYSTAQYDFIAWSTGSKTPIYEGTPTDGEVLVSAIDPNATATAAVTFSGTADDLSQIYISDLNTVKKEDYGDAPVTMSFRQLGTKVRIGIYETVPGYSVKEVKFYTTGGLLTKTGDDLDPGQIVDEATIFSTAADIYTEGTYTVTYPTVDDPSNANNNQAHVTFAPKSGVSQTTKVEWGSLNYTIAEEGEKTAGKVFLGRSSNTASFAGNPADNYYVTYLPNETGTNLNLRVDFTLEATDGGGETINVKNAKAQVPSIYTTWKPGFAYTYLFKISDKTNGRTGVYDPTQPDDATINSDPAGLYPITFDAVVVNAEEDATQETITTVSTPSITTYQQESTVVNADEYTVNGKDIFVTVNEGDVIVPLKKAKGTDPETYDIKAALYTLSADKTEAEVVDALQMQDDDAAANTIKGRSGLVLTEADFTLTNTVQFGADGNPIEIEATNGEQKALRFTPAANTTYAFVYTKTASTTTTNKYEPVTVANGASVAGLYRWGLKNAPAGDVKKGVKYFTGVNTDVLTVFLGQTVNNLYLDEAGTIASGYAVTGTTYYYTTNNGMSYQAAHNVNYADFDGTLFVEGSTPGEFDPNPDATPQDGTAYYYYDTVSGKYIYCVILPQQTNDGTTQLKIFKTPGNSNSRVACAADDVAYEGWEYFDKYTKNNGEYYTKVIKVQ